MKFKERIVETWNEFAEELGLLSGEWAFSGQTSDWPLRTSLERALINHDVDLRKGPAVEQQIIRDFRRRYRGEEENRVNSDMLYCLGMMQHYGAPTRLLDWLHLGGLQQLFVQVLELCQEASLVRLGHIGQDKKIKAARGFVQFSMRVLEKMRGEWTIVCLTHNLLKLFGVQNAIAA